MDELPEFNRTGLEALRMPIEDGEVLVSRAAGSVCLPGAVHGRRGDEPVPLRTGRAVHSEASAPKKARSASTTAQRIGGRGRRTARGRLLDGVSC
jgi:predicted ATPase with chaperone activity